MSDPTFSHDWQSPNFPTWERVLPVAGDPDVKQLLEIGCYEGRATCWLLDRYPEAVISCFDTFDGGDDHKQLGIDFSSVEDRFHANMAPYGGLRVRLCKGSSFHGLHWALPRISPVDIALIDGSHLACDVLADAVLTWPMLKQRGILIFDDYGWGSGRPPHQTPKPAIDAFLSCYTGQYEVLEQGYQVLVRKL